MCTIIDRTSDIIKLDLRPMVSPKCHNSHNMINQLKRCLLNIERLVLFTDKLCLICHPCNPQTKIQASGAIKHAPNWSPLVTSYSEPANQQFRVYCIVNMPHALHLSFLSRQVSTKSLGFCSLRHTFEQMQIIWVLLNIYKSKDDEHILQILIRTPCSWLYFINKQLAFGRMQNLWKKTGNCLSVTSRHRAYRYLLCLC